MLTVVNIGKNRYLEAALSVLRSHGVASLTMRTVAERAGTTATAIYRHFPGKDGLLDALLQEVYSDFRERMFAASALETAGDRLWTMLEEYREFALERPHDYEILFNTPHGIRVSRYPDDFRALRSATFRLLVERVAECMEEKLFSKDDPVDVALTIDAHAAGLVALQRSGRFGSDESVFRQFYRESLQRLVDGLRAPGANTASPLNSR